MGGEEWAGEGGALRPPSAGAVASQEEERISVALSTPWEETSISAFSTIAPGPPDTRIGVCVCAFSSARSWLAGTAPASSCSVVPSARSLGGGGGGAGEVPGARVGLEAPAAAASALAARFLARRRADLEGVGSATPGRAPLFALLPTCRCIACCSRMSSTRMPRTRRRFGTEYDPR